MQITDYLVLFGSVMIGGITFFLIRKPDQRILKLILSFSGAFLFALSVLHLMPDVYLNSGASIGAWIMLGFFIQIILEFFSEGIEHGHVHIHAHHEGVFPLTMMVSLCLHSFLEGMPLAGRLAATSTAEHHHDHSLLFGIILHHLPVAFALVSMLMASGIGKNKTILLLVVFAIMGPLGAGISQMLSDGILINITSWYDKIMAVVIGIFLHISTTILFESSSDHRFNLYKMAAIATGGIIGFIAS
ncbi:ZIP family metal transporter [soil metagenome]